MGSVERTARALGVSRSEKVLALSAAGNGPEAARKRLCILGRKNH
ncbi:MAG TPA: hypothetical protein VEL76_22985 [Gemmataceae bacterium]|nr:hypothetical protein [Gemmataceae bacterium]